MTPTTDDPLALIRHRIDVMPRALRQVATLIIEDAEWVLRANVDEIGERAAVSPPTIIRFCREMGYSGLRDFKLILAQRLAVGIPHMDHGSQPWSNGYELLQTVYTDMCRLVGTWTKSCDPNSIDKAIDALANANRIDCYGIGNTSMFLANDAQSRLFRLGKNSHAYFDPHMQMYSAATLSTGDVLLAISHVGIQSTLLEAVSVAKKGGATVIGITQRGTPLATQSDIVLSIVMPEDTSIRMGVESNTSQLLLLESLIVGVSSKSSAKKISDLERFQTVLTSRKN
jgi:RpiR family carbohydrate utilization transcriptional regulator